MRRLGNVLSFSPQRRRPASLRVRLLDGRASTHDPARSRQTLDQLLRRDPFSDAHPIDPVELFGRRARRWVIRHQAGIAVFVGTVVGVLFAIATGSVLR